MRTLAYLAFISTLLISSCKGKETLVTEGACTDCEEAVIRDYGDPALDGCGFVVEIDSTVYMPQNLPSAYHKDNLRVQINYDVKDEVRCGLVQTYPSIAIKEIRKRQ